MVTGPIFRVEMVSAARRRRYFLVRVLYCAIILFVLWVTYENVTTYNALVGGASTSISDMARAASAFFLTFSWVQLIGILLVAPAMVVGTIATERERRTIEFLFASDLSNLEIVLGKTIARLLLIGQLVLASLPILFIFRLMGGIPADLLAASFLIAASTGLLVTAISVWVSVWSPRARDAAMRVYRVLGVLLIGVPLIMQLLNFAGLNHWLVDAVRDALGLLWELNPMYVLGMAMSSSFAIGAGFNFEPVLRMLAWHVGISFGLSALATMAVRRVHLKEASRGSMRRWQWQAPRWIRRWKPTMGNHAMLWKEAFAPTAKVRLGIIGVAANVLVAVGAIGWTLYMFWYVAFDAGILEPENYFIFTTIFTGVIGSALLLLLGARASSLVTLEKERDTWISLLSTPLSGAEIIIGKLLGNLYAARWGFVLMAFAWVLALLFSPGFLAVMPILAGTFLLAAVFVTGMGLLFSLRSKTSLRAMSLTLITVMFVGGGYMLCCCPVVAMSDPPDEAMQLGLSPCLPFLLAAPAGFYLNALDDGANVETELVVSYVFGVLLYLIVSGVLVAYLTTTFDEAAGRTADMPEGSRLGPAIRPLTES